MKNRSLHAKSDNALGMARIVRLVAFTAPFAALLLAPSLAFAHDEPGGVTHAQPTEPEVGGEKKEETEPPWEVLGEVVGGATTTEVLAPGKFTRVEQPPNNTFDSTRVSAYSFLFGIERHFGERLTLGVRLPFVEADLASRTFTNEDRSVFEAGNVELEGAFVITHGRNWNLVGSLGVALPTAGGKEAPSKDEVSKDPEKRYDYKRYDSFAGVQAGSAVRGAYDSALFEPGRLGIVPQVSANFHLQKLTVTPTVKLENLVDVTGDAAQSYVGELVGGVRASYRLASWFEPGVHVWANILYTTTDLNSPTVAVVEPFLSFPLPVFRITAGAIVPFAGYLADEKTFGFRFSVVASF
jgi:hypothetical protein